MATEERKEEKKEVAFREGKENYAERKLRLADPVNIKDTANEQAHQQCSKYYRGFPELRERCKEGAAWARYKDNEKGK